MINFEAFFKLSYGLYVVAAGDKSSGNAYIANTAFQVTAEPPQIAICCNKDNYTSGFIQKSKQFSISILEENASSDTIGKFGFKSGKDTNKFEGSNVIYGETGCPIVLDDSIAYLECELVSTHDVGTHTIFIGKIKNAELLNADKEPITYANYRRIRKGLAPKNAPTYVDKSKITQPSTKTDFAKYKCNVCGYVYDESESGVKFGDLPADWHCPVCGADKEEFSLVQ